MPDDKAYIYCVYMYFKEVGPIDLIHESQNAPVQHPTMHHSEQKYAAFGQLITYLDSICLSVINFVSSR